MFQGQPMLPDEMDVSVSELVSLLNQTFDYAFPAMSIVGELANLRVSKGKWLYFDLKDEMSTVKFFGTVYHLPGPLEDGMLLRVHGSPKLHNQYGFSVNVQTIQPAGEGTIRRAAALLQAQLTREGLFDDARKRAIPHPPKRIGLITSAQSAAYADFIKVLQARWSGLEIQLIDVQVQGDIAPAQIASGLEQFNASAELPDVVVLIRGGGSAEDLAAFNTEQVTRAIAASRAPTLVAIGHEIDTSLAELAADRRASTPSNAAELLVPDREQTRLHLIAYAQQLEQIGQMQIRTAQQQLTQRTTDLNVQIAALLTHQTETIKNRRQLVQAFDPSAILRRGYAIVRSSGRLVRNGQTIAPGAIVNIEISDAYLEATVIKVDALKENN